MLEVERIGAGPPILFIHGDIVGPELTWRKQRELEDAKREVELTVEKKVQENLATVRDKARLEAEDALKSKVTEKETQIAGMARQHAETFVPLHHEGLRPISSATGCELA